MEFSRRKKDPTTSQSSAASPGPLNESQSEFESSSLSKIYREVQGNSKRVSARSAKSIVTQEQLDYQIFNQVFLPKHPPVV